MKNPFDDNFSDVFIAAPTAEPAGPLGGGPPPSVLGAPIIVPDEELEAEAAVAASGNGGPGSVVTVSGATSAGLIINLVFDAAAMAAPQSFRDGITAAMQMICAVVTDHITLNFQIHYSGTGGGAAAGPSGGNYVSYSTVHSDLVNNASPGDTTFSFLPSSSASSVAVWYSQEKLWGLISPTGTEVDGSATFSTDIDPSLLVGVALHELTHAMGRVPYAGSSGQPDIFDFYRFTSAGNILISGSNSAPPAYFSLNNGASKIADYGQTSDPSDFLNSGVQGSTDPFNEFYSNSTQQQLTAIDLMQLDALGFHLLSNQQTQTVIESFGSTKLVQVGSNFFLNPVAGGTGPELKYGGAAFVAGSTWGAWAPIGAEAISGGYEVAFKTGTDSYTVWDTDTNGNITTNALGTTSGSSTALEALETSFQQDLNGDHVIGVPAAPASTIEAFGSTALVQSGNNYFLNPVAGGTGPELKYGGAAFTANSTWGSWAPIGAEAISGGYEVAFKMGADTYTVWDTDSNGNITTNVLPSTSGSSTALEALETSFQQDLNGDHVIGIPSAPSSTTIEAFGSTALVQSGNNYFLNPVAGGTGPELKYGGAAFTSGSTWGAWAPIGAEAISGGYEVAFKIGTDTYTVWDTDTNGNITTNVLATTSGSNTALESLETSFQQDLNGDHTIGIPAHTAPSAQVASAAPAAQAAPSLGGGDSFAFRPDLGSLGGGNAPPPAASPAAGEMLTLASAPVAHVDVVDVHDLGGVHDGAVQGAIFDPLHGFIIH
jgi:20S proteasome alpha/beta subunit